MTSRRVNPDRTRSAEGDRGAPCGSGSLASSIMGPGSRASNAWPGRGQTAARPEGCCRSSGAPRELRGELDDPPLRRLGDNRVAPDLGGNSKASHFCPKCPTSDRSGPRHVLADSTRASPRTALRLDGPTLLRRRTYNAGLYSAVEQVSRQSFGTLAWSSASIKRSGASHKPS